MKNIPFVVLAAAFSIVSCFGIGNRNNVEHENQNLLARVKRLEDDLKALTKTQEDAALKSVASLEKHAALIAANSKQAQANFGKINRYPYVKSFRKALPGNGKTYKERLIKTSEGFAILSEIRGKFEGKGERVWIGTEKVGEINYWFLYGHSQQPDVTMSAFVFKYPRAP